MSNSKNKLAFLSMPAPASYVAGLGRGYVIFLHARIYFDEIRASGFTTRSDIGPAREGPSAEAIAEAQAKRGEEAEVDPEQFQDPDNEFGLFAGTTYEADDEEADRIYEAVDNAMDSRRRSKREMQEQEELAKFRAERPKIQQQFADLKRGLSAVTDSEWESLPEVGNLTRKKRKKDERAFVVPDSVLVGDRAKGEYESSLDTGPGEGDLTNFVEIGQARDKILSLKLDQLSSTPAVAGTSTSIDPKGYLTSLDSVIIKSDAEIGDIKRARMLFESLIKSNPKHAPGWIAAACLEEHAGRMVLARKIIKQGCHECPKNEDVWIEAARLHSNADAKVILAEAAQHLPQSVRIWLTAASLETLTQAKKRVLRKALEQIPNSVRLWKETVNLESNPSDAKILLARAVEVIPLSVELWLALARLETPAKARAVLNKARKAVPTSYEIWIAAGRLLEQDGADGDQVDKTIEAGVRELRKHQVSLSRDQWLKEAERCEEEGSPRTCEAIIKATLGMDVEEEDQLDVFTSDADSAESRGRIGTARAILAYALRLFPGDSSLWRRASELEKTHGGDTQPILARAVEACPKSEVLWLMAAKERWIAGDVPGARDILDRAFAWNAGSEGVWLAAFKLESENGEYGAARALLQRAREEAGTERIWIKSAVFERQQGQLDIALRHLADGLKKYPKSAKMYMIQGQIHTSRGSISEARAADSAGCKASPKEPTLWVLSSRLEEKDGKTIKARALLDKARGVNPANELLWAEAIGVEERAALSSTASSQAQVQAKTMLSRALQECPSSGLLWTLAIFAEPRPGRKAKSVDALRKSSDHPLVVCAVARVFWETRMVEKAREWFGRAVKSEEGKDLGDCWAWWMAFEREYGEAERKENLRKMCTEADPKHGYVWPAVRKDVANTGKSIVEVLDLVADRLLSGVVL